MKKCCGKIKQKTVNKITQVYCSKCEKILKTYIKDVKKDESGSDSE